MVLMLLHRPGANMQGQTPQAIQRPSEVNMHGRLANEVSDKIPPPPPAPIYIFHIDGKYYFHQYAIYFLC